MRLTGGEIVAEYLIGAGVPYVVGIPGHGCLGLVDAFFTRRDRLQVLQVRHEQAAVHLADGYYRASGKPLAVFTSIGPGAANTAVGLGTAYVDSTAVLVLSGETHTHMFGRGVLQEVERQHWANFSRSLEPLTKRYWLANRVENLPFVMQRAFATMTTGRPGTGGHRPADGRAGGGGGRAPARAGRASAGGPPPGGPAPGGEGGRAAADRGAARHPRRRRRRPRRCPRRAAGARRRPRARRW